MFLAALLLFSLTRAEIIQRMRAPIVTQADGLVKVYARCDEDVRRDFQQPVARFANDTITALYASLSEKSVKFQKPGIVVFLGNDRTNTTEVVSEVVTNDNQLVSRILLKSPGFSDIDRFRLEVVKGFFRSVKATDLDDDAAWKALRKADPRYRIADERAALELWLAGKRPEGAPQLNSEEAVFEEVELNLARMRKVLEPGVASKRDVLIFASRLCLYPRTLDEKFVGGADVVSFKEAIELSSRDPRVRLLAYFKTKELPVFAGGRGDYLAHAGEAYNEFLTALAKGDLTNKELERLLEVAELKLKAAYAQGR